VVSYSRVELRTSSDRIAGFALGGSGVNNSLSLTGAPAIFDGIGMMLDHSTGTGTNSTFWGWTRSGLTMVGTSGNSVQFNTAGCFVSIQLQSNLNSGVSVNGTNTGTIFALHFLRRVAAASPGHIAQL
jgi:hypothetical protein